MADTTEFRPGAGAASPAAAADRRAGPRRHRLAYWSAVLVALLVLAGGTAVAGLGYAATSGAQGTVRGYFAALARADAPAALGFGDVPSGRRALLTSTVLRAQQDVAAIQDVHVGASIRPAGRVVVPVHYTLAFASGDRRVSVDVPVHRAAGSWRLDATAVATEVHLSVASQRATIAGAAVPSDEVLLFPGALPLRFDTPYLEIAAADDTVRAGRTEVTVRVSGAGRRAMTAATVSALRACLAGQFDAGNATCPLPDERYIPGSLRGSVTGAPQSLTVSLAPVDVGIIDLLGKVPVRISYRRLDFHNHVDTGRSRQLIYVHATSGAVAPIALRWALP